MNKSKLRAALAKLNELEDNSSVDGDIVAVAERLVNDQLDTVRKSLSTGPLVKELAKLNQEVKIVKSGLDLKPVLFRIDTITSTFNSLSKAVSKLEKLSERERKETSAKLAESVRGFASLKKELEAIKNRKDPELDAFRKELPALKEATTSSLDAVYARLDQMEKEEVDEVSPLKKRVEDVRNELISKMTGHGDHANRNIAIGGNTSVLSRYTDINLKAGANVTITYAYNDLTKYTDVTLASSGGGGGGTWGSITGTLSSQTDLQTALDAKQPLDSDLTTIAGLTATTDNFIQAKSSAWASRTVAQVKTDLGLTGTNSGDQTITLTGDVTGTGTGSFAATVKTALKDFAHGFTTSGTIVTGKVSGFYTAPQAATIVGWNLTVDAGTMTVKTWKIASGTAKPTAANSINTSGVAISSGTAIQSTTLSDFTTTAVSAGDIIAFEITAVSGVADATFELIMRNT